MPTITVDHLDIQALQASRQNDAATSGGAPNMTAFSSFTPANVNSSFSTDIHGLASPTTDWERSGIEQQVGTRRICQV